MRRSTRARVEKLASSLGVVLDINTGTGFADAWSPSGKVFSANHAHCVAAHFSPGPWLAEVYGSLVDDLELGLEDCTTLDCEVCAARQKLDKGEG